MKRKDLTGKKFGKLTVIKPGETVYTKSGQSKSTWVCQCECGNIKQVRTNNLLSGNVLSCGCLKAENNHARNFIDETGNRYGKLTVLERYFENNKENRALWLCLCDCGNKRIVSGTDLRNGRVNSCGCIVSVNEAKIEKILKDHNINYVKQYTFKDLKSPKESLLKFDFAIIEDNKLSHLIEFDGIQHFQFREETSGWNTEENFIKIKQNDELKNQYCAQHKIKLIRIKYDEDYNFDKLMGKD